MNDDYSQAGQDLFVLSFFEEGYHGTFVDVGCWLPKRLNNTLRLEERGWRGVSFDVKDFSNEWRGRKTPFVLADALSCDFKDLFDQMRLPLVIDYLSLDVEGVGSRFHALVNVFRSGREFKIITIEHDAYRKGHIDLERNPQREFLRDVGYFLLCANVMITPNPFEDWWVHPNYIDKEVHLDLLSDGLDYREILKAALSA